NPGELVTQHNRKRSRPSRPGLESWGPLRFGTHDRCCVNLNQDLAGIRIWPRNFPGNEGFRSALFSQVDRFHLVRRPSLVPRHNLAERLTTAFKKVWIAAAISFVCVSSAK